MDWLSLSMADEEERRRRRERTTAPIGIFVNRFVGIHFLGWLALSVGAVGRTYLFLGLGALLLLLSLGMAVWLAWSVLRNAMILRWYWFLIGLIPWGVICGEATAVLWAALV